MLSKILSFVRICGGHGGGGGGEVSRTLGQGRRKRSCSLLAREAHPGGGWGLPVLSELVSAESLLTVVRQSVPSAHPSTLPGGPAFSDGATVRSLLPGAFSLLPTPALTGCTPETSA